uniref:Uncharacterized protein n=1 Tax=Pyrrhoderma lamaoense TaxID=2282106 RepID=A0A5B9R9T3_9AGAM|nr:hypothetical protein PLAO_000048 [Phellinus lamaoensis]QEG57132.1 hypothetical protein PLAO_000048 [Phellinus lamaoensis]
MNKFFSRLEISPEYLYLRVILLTEDDKHLSCGRVHIIKWSDKAKSDYVKEIVSEFRSFLQRYKAAGYKEIKIFYKPVTLEEYKEFKLKADKYMSKGKAHSVIDSLKLPKADSYSLWGRHEKITDTLFVITKCTINKDIRSITIEKEETSNRLRVELKNGNIYIIQDSLVNGHLANRTLVRSNVKLSNKEPQLNLAKPKVPVDCSVTSLTPCFANLTLTQKSLRNIELSVKDVKETYQFITLDLETIIEDTGYGDKGMKLLSASIYDGTSSHSWYIGNYLKGNSYGEAKAAMVQDIFDSIFSYRPLAMVIQRVTVALLKTYKIRSSIIVKEIERM